MNTYVIVLIKTNNFERFFLKCRGLGIAIFHTEITEEGMIIKILESDYKKLHKIWFIQYKKVDVEGVLKVGELVKKNFVFFVALIVGCVLLFLISHVIVDVDVIHSNKEIRDLVTNALKEHGIVKNTWRKSYQEIQEIKESILEEYPLKLEWLEIESKGMKYVVRIEERKINEEETVKYACHIVATKDGIVKQVIYSKGEALYKENDYVRAGDILITGSILKDGEEKSVVCATGSVYAEVWYQVSVHVPLTYTEQTETGKVRWNFKVKNNMVNDFIFKSRVNSYVEELHPLVKLFGTEFQFVRQKEVIEEEKNYTEEEALNKALEEVDSKVSSTLDENEKILYKKVLKKEQNNSTMDVEVFVAVLESIGEQQEFERELSGNDGYTTIN